jgi:hypothetical protein
VEETEECSQIDQGNKQLDPESVLRLFYILCLVFLKLEQTSGEFVDFDACLTRRLSRSILSFAPRYQTKVIYEPSLKAAL